MKLWKNKRLWLCAAVFLVFEAAIWPYYHDMYIADAFTAICVLLNGISGAMFATLLYQKLSGTLKQEDYGTWVWVMLWPGLGHGLFSMMSYGSWVCLGLTAVIWAAMAWDRFFRGRKLSLKLSRRQVGILLLVLLVLCAFLVYNNPRMRAEVFLTFHRQALEQTIGQSWDPTALNISGSIDHRVYAGEHPIIEFPLTGRGIGSQTSYYGCYYSYDDVPRNIRQESAELYPHGDGIWRWYGEGDNHGQMEKLMPHWYYYEAHY